MRIYYTVTEALKNALENEITKTVTLGDITEVDLNKRSIFPLAHIIVNSGAITERTISLDVSILFMDLVDVSLENVKDQAEPFYGANDLQDVHNTQLAAANLLVQSMVRGALWDDDIKVEGTPTVEPFKDRFENTLAGWVLNFTVEARNTDTSIC